MTDAAACVPQQQQPLQVTGKVERLKRYQYLAWWNRDSKEVLARQGIETQPGPSGGDGSSHTEQMLHIVSRNIRGLFHNLANTIRTRADVICLQEVDINEADVADMRAQAAVAGYTIYFASKAQLTKDGAGPWGRRAAIMVKSDIKATIITPCDDEEAITLLRTGRYVECLVPVANGLKHVVVASYYGIPGASSEGQTKRDNEQNVARIKLGVKKLRDVPYFLGTDLNCNPRTSPGMSQGIREGTLHDVVDECFLGNPPPTHKKGGITPDMAGEGVTRIDTVMTNPAGANALDRLEYNYRVNSRHTFNSHVWRDASFLVCWWWVPKEALIHNVVQCSFPDSLRHSWRCTWVTVKVRAQKVRYIPEFFYS